MKIAYYSYDHVKNPYCGGGGAYRDLMIHRQLAKKHALTCYCGKIKGVSDYSEDQITFSFLGSATNYLISRITFSLAATLHALFVKADVIVICYSVYSPVVSFLFRKRNTIIELFHLTDTGPFRKYSLFGLAPFIAEKLALVAGRHFICINELLTGFIKTRYKKQSVTTVYTGFDTRLISENRGDNHYVLFLGRIDIYMKGIDLLIDTFETISRSFPDHRLIIAGRGSPHDVSWLRNRIKTSQAGTMISFNENVTDEEKTSLFHYATFVCMPSRFEGWCIAAIEAAASSKATLGTRISGLSESIRDGETGILVEPEDKKALAEKMALLLTDTDLRTRLGNNGFRWAQNFTWENIAQKQEERYVEVASRP